MDSHNCSTVDNVLRFLKWRSCALGTVIGCVCTSILGLCIGLIVHPYLLSKDQKQCPTEIHWDRCSVECGSGIQYGMKINRKDVNGICLVTSKRSIERSCNIVNDVCPVDGGWGQWKLIGSCSETCGTGLIPIARSCDNPVPSNNGKYCNGKHFGQGICIKTQCAGKNLALNKETAQVSYYTEYNHPRNSSVAVDGNLITNNHTICTHTLDDYKAWWAVDLADLYDIHRVVVYGRTDCCTHRLSNFDIDIFKSRTTNKLEFSNFQDGIKSKCHYQSGDVPNHVLNAQCPPDTNGQFVRIQLRGTDFLTLCEVEVYGSYGKNHSNRLIENSDYEFETPYLGPEVNIVSNTTREHCNSFCSKGSSEEDCFASYSRQRNTCAIAGNTTTAL